MDMLFLKVDIIAGVIIVGIGAAVIVRYMLKKKKAAKAEGSAEA